jgi:hypothetical protein
MQNACGVKVTKVLVIVTSKEKEKINLALNFAKHQKSDGHEVRLLLFGPSEETVSKDEGLLKTFSETGDIKPMACIYIAHEAKIEDQLKQSFGLLPAGKYITSAIDEGYSVISF